MSAQNRRSFSNRVRGFASVFNGAREAAAAVEAGRRPTNRSLNALGIDPNSFDGIGRS